MDFEAADSIRIKGRCLLGYLKIMFTKDTITEALKSVLDKRLTYDALIGKGLATT